jgi:hypothetical protein
MKQKIDVAWWAAWLILTFLKPFEKVSEYVFLSLSDRRREKRTCRTCQDRDVPKSGPNLSDRCWECMEARATAGIGYYSNWEPRDN